MTELELLQALVATVTNIQHLLGHIWIALAIIIALLLGLLIDRIFKT